MHAGTWDTVLGTIAFDAKGDITIIDYVMYQWSKDGKYGEMGKGT